MTQTALIARLRKVEEALDFGRLGPEGETTHQVAEAEAQRLHDLMEKIDAMTSTPPNAEVTGA